MSASLRAQPVPRLLLAGTVGLLLATTWSHVPARAATANVAVQSDDTGGLYDPDTITIRVGDAVTWLWEGDNHSVTHDAPPVEEREFDSHECAGGLLSPCGQTGDRFAHRFLEVGTFEYFCRVHPATMRGTVHVEPAAEPTETPTATATPSPPRPRPTDTEPPVPEPSETGQPTEPAPSETGTEPAPPTASETDAPPPGTAAPPDAPAGSPAPQEPQVAADTSSPLPIPYPTFDDFPDASDPESDLGSVAVGGGDDGDQGSRTLWALVGGMSVLATLSAFGRIVLFGEPWAA